LRDKDRDRHRSSDNVYGHSGSRYDSNDRGRVSDRDRTGRERSRSRDRKDAMPAVKMTTKETYKAKALLDIARKERLEMVKKLTHGGWCLRCRLLFCLLPIHNSYTL
jgi:hypothetical protein